MLKDLKGFIIDWYHDGFNYACHYLFTCWHMDHYHKGNTRRSLFWERQVDKLEGFGGTSRD